MSAHPVTKRWRRGIWTVFIAVFVFLGLLHTGEVMTFPALSRPLPPQNPDDWLRLMLVRDWLSGGDIYSHAVPRTNAPFGGIASHWTRLHDFVLAFFTKLMPAKPLDMKLLLAATWYPVVLAIGQAMLLTGAARRLFRHNHVLACALLLLMTGLSVTYYLKPGDADHHGLMGLMWCGVLYLMLDNPLEKARAFVIGSLLGAIIWVSPEGLLLQAGVLGVLGLGALGDKKDGRKINTLFPIALGAALVVSAGLLVEIPPAEWLKRQTYDSLSIVHAAFLWLVAGGSFFLTLLWPFARTIQARLYVAFASGMSVLLLMYALYPKFFLGPMADADPYIFTNFLPMVDEAKPLLHPHNPDLFRSLMLPVLVGILLLTSFLRMKLRAARKEKLLRLAGLWGFVFILACFQRRWGYYLEPAGIIIVAGLLPAVAVLCRKFPAPRRWQPYLWLVCAFAFTMAATFAPLLTATAAKKPALTDGCLQEIRYVLQTQQLQKLLGDKPLTLYTMEDAGGEALFFTPYRIIASNYHREAAGMKDMKAIRQSASAEELRQLLKKRKVDAMLYCPAYHRKNEVLNTIDKKRSKWMMPVAGLKFFREEENLPQLVRVKP